MRAISDCPFCEGTGKCEDLSEAAEIDTSTQLSRNARTVLRRGAVQNVTEAVDLRLRER